VGAVREGSAPDTLLLLEHPHVFTLGKPDMRTTCVGRGRARTTCGRRHLVRSGRRGERITGGPARRVPILDIAHSRWDFRRTSRKLERSAIGFLGELGIKSEPGAHGFDWRLVEWREVGGHRDQAQRLGVSQDSRWNLTTELDYFDGTSLADTSTAATQFRPYGQRIDTETAAARVRASFPECFWRRLEMGDYRSLISSQAAGAGRAPHI